MKKIIFSTFDDNTSERRGGTAIAVHEIARRLTREYKVTVLAAKREGSRDQVLDGVRYEHIGVTFGDMRFRQLVYLLLLPWHVFFRKYDVWIEAFTGPISTAFLPLFTRRPVIGVTHFFNGDEMKKKYKLPFDWIERLGVKTFKNLVVLTKFQKEKAFEMNSNAEIRIIPNGIDSRYSDIHRDPKSHLLYIGRMEVYMKGLDMLIDSIESILSVKKGINLILAGKGNDSDINFLREKAGKPGLDRRVIFRGYVNDQEKDELLSQAVLFLSPSRFETFGISLLEAMSAGVPAVVFDIPDFQWIPNYCVKKIPQFDIQKYAEAIQYFLDNPEERELLGRQGKDFAGNFSWEISVEKYKNFIEAVINEDV